jgi:hypothetical protein
MTNGQGLILHRAACGEMPEQAGGCIIWNPRAVARSKMTIHNRLNRKQHALAGTIPDLLSRLDDEIS